MRSAIILVGGRSSRFGDGDKGLFKIAGKPMVRHVYNRIKGSVEEVLVVGKKGGNLEEYSKLLDKAVMVEDKLEVVTPLSGIMAGMEAARGEVVAVLPCDIPLVSEEVVEFLLDVCEGRGAAIPRWPNGFLEPLQATYNREATLKAARETYEEGELGLLPMIDKIKGILYISTIALRSLDPQLNTFLNVNTLDDARRVEGFLKGARGIVARSTS